MDPLEQLSANRLNSELGRRERVAGRDKGVAGDKGHDEMTVLGAPGGSVAKNPLPMQDLGLSPDLEDATCHRTTKPRRHNY